MERFDTRYRGVAAAIDDTLVATHGLLADLGADAPPFWVPAETGVGREQRIKDSIAMALDHYGPGRRFNLWVACRALEELRLQWTGESIRPDLTRKSHG